MFCSAPRKRNLIIFATTSSHCLLVLSPCWVEIHHLWRYTSKINKICHDYLTDRGFWKWSSRNIWIYLDCFWTKSPNKYDLGVSQWLRKPPYSHGKWPFPASSPWNRTQVPLLLAVRSASQTVARPRRGKLGIRGFGGWIITKPIKSMCGIYANIWGILMVIKCYIYSSTMDPMGNHILLDHFCHSKIGVVFETAPMLMT